MPEIYVSKTRAQINIGDLMETGEEMLAQIRSVKTAAELQDIRNDVDTWFKEGYNFCGRLFRNVGSAQQYTLSNVGISDPDNSLTENKRSVEAAVKARVDQLRSLAEQLPDFQQSELTPTGGVRN